MPGSAFGRVGPKLPLSTRPLSPLTFLLQPDLRHLRIPSPSSPTIFFATRSCNPPCGFLVSLYYSRNPHFCVCFVVGLRCHFSQRAGRFIRVLCPSTGEELTSLKFSSASTPRRRISPSTTHTTHPDMALKRINKELTDLGRYVLGIHFAPSSACSAKSARA